MSSLNIGLVYFSATDVTRSYARVIKTTLEEKGCPVKMIDVTPVSARQAAPPLPIADAYIFGFPVYSDFAPQVINTWLPTLEGAGKRCATFFTYGGRTSGYAHFHTKKLLEEAGFCVQFSAEFLGRHSFNVAGWQALTERPNDQDFAIAREFAALACERLARDLPTPFSLQKPFAYNKSLKLKASTPPPTERRANQPQRSTETCSMCRRCASECPSGAFDADSGLSDPALCISCMRCVYICPDKVIKVDDRMRDFYANFLKDWHLDDAMMRAKRSKIITESWQAAF